LPSFFTKGQMVATARREHGLSCPAQSLSPPSRGGPATVGRVASPAFGCYGLR
jgi:hypothetical protein